MSKPKLSMYGARRRRHHEPLSSPPTEQDIVIDFNSLPSYQIVIKSFRRFKCLYLLVTSILKHYPEASIVIADDSFENPEVDLPALAREIKSIPNVTWVQLSFNAGLSAGRNAAVKATTADVVLMCDDDYVFTRETRIENMLAVLAERNDIDVVAGCVRFDGVNATGWHCLLNWFDDGPLTAVRLNTLWQDTSGVRHRATDLALNWYAARRDTLVRVPWDNQFKIVMEHIDHFMCLKAAGVKVHYTPDCIVGHEPRSSEDYGPFRMQDVDAYRVAFLKKWNIKSRLGYAMQTEPCLKPIVPEAGSSVLVFGVGHSGTTIATQMVEALGFNAHNADTEYRENSFVRELNQQCLETGALDVPSARRELAYLEQAGPPWVLKDPRFVHTLEHWQSLFAAYRPFMLFVTRDPVDMAGSFERRGEGPKTRGVSIAEACALAENEFDRWPWAKLKVDLSQLAAASALFDAARP